MKCGLACLPRAVECLSCTSCRASRTWASTASPISPAMRRASPSSLRSSRCPRFGRRNQTVQDQEGTALSETLPSVSVALPFAPLQAIQRHLPPPTQVDIWARALDLDVIFSSIVHLRSYLVLLRSWFPASHRERSNS